MPTDMPDKGEPEKHPVHKFFTNGFVQGVAVFIALAVAFSGKLDSKGTLVAVLVAGAIGAIGIYTHLSTTVRRRIIAAISIAVYGCVLWAFYYYLTSKPVLSAGNTITQQPDAKSEEKKVDKKEQDTQKPEGKKTEPPKSTAKKTSPKVEVEQHSQGDNSPNINQESFGPNSPNIAGNNNQVTYGATGGWQFDGSLIEIPQPGIVRKIVGNEHWRLLDTLLPLEQQAKWQELIDASEAWMKQNPEWLTPNILAAEGYLRLGNRQKAKELLEYVDKRTQGNKQYDIARSMLRDMQNP